MQAGGPEAREAGELASPVLVLNRSCQPVRVTTAREAFLLLYLGRALALDDAYEARDFATWRCQQPGPGHVTIGTSSGLLRVPRIVQLRTYNRVPRLSIRLSRRNVFLRDGYTCQYCGLRPPLRDLNLDHVVPRSRGGASSWENLVTSCRHCNTRKACSLPGECGMPLRSRPRRPTWSPRSLMATIGVAYDEWAPFVGGGQNPG